MYGYPMLVDWSTAVIPAQESGLLHVLRSKQTFSVSIENDFS